MVQPARRINMASGGGDTEPWAIKDRSNTVHNNQPTWLNFKRPPHTRSAGSDIVTSMAKMRNRQSPHRAALIKSPTETALGWFRPRQPLVVLSRSDPVDLTDSRLHTDHVATRTCRCHWELQKSFANSHRSLSNQILRISQDVP